MKIHKGRLPITKPGIYSGIHLSDYHSARIVPEGEYAVSSSGLRTMWSKSPAHFYDTWAHNPNRTEVERTKYMIFGSAVHHLFLGEDNFASEFVTQPRTYIDKRADEKPWTYQATACKEWRERQERRGLTIVTHEQLERIRGMADSLRKEALVMDHALEGAVECSMLVKDQESGLWLKSRPDVIPTSSGDYCDLKVQSDITDVGIKVRMREAGYAMQAGLLWEVCDQLGLPFQGFNLFFLEPERPFCVRVVPMDSEDLSLGRQQCRSMIRKVRSCIDTGVWPGPGEGLLEKLRLPITEREFITARLQAEGLA